MMNEHEEKISIIENAIFGIESIMTEVDGAISGTSQQAHYEAYGKYGFNQLLGNGNPYDNSLFTLIEELKTVDQICKECGSLVQSPENTLCDPCNDKYEKRCVEQENK